MLLNRWPVKSAAITLPTELQPLPLTRSNLLPSFVCSFLSTKLKRGPNFTLLNKKRFSFWNHCCCCCCCCCCYLRSSSFSHIPKKFNYVRFKVRPSRGVWRSRDFGSDDFISERQKITYHCGRWLWPIWMNGHFWHQRSAVWTLSSENFICYQLYLICIEKAKINIKRPGMAHLKTI